MYFLIRWLINIISLFVVLQTVGGVSAQNTQAIIVAALVIGLLNAFLRPIMIAITLPLTVMTFGFFTLIINASIFYLAAKFVKGFFIAGFWNAFWASIVFSVISLILNTMLIPGADFKIRYFSNAAGRRPRYTGVIDVEGKAEEDAKDDNLKRNLEEK